MISNEVNTENLYKGNIPLLNPQESFGVTITLNSIGVISEPEIQARAIGATAINEEQYNQARSQRIQSLIFITFVSFVAWICTSAILGKFTSDNKEAAIRTDNAAVVAAVSDIKNSIARATDSKKDKADEPDEGPDSSQIVFVLFSKHGLMEYWSGILARSSQTGVGYWQTGFYLMEIFADEGEKSDKIINAMEELTNLGKVSKVSRSQNMYLLAKMYRFKNLNDKADAVLLMAKEASPLTYDFLLKNDQFFSMEAFKKARK